MVLKYSIITEGGLQLETETTRNEKSSIYTYVLTPVFNRRLKLSEDPHVTSMWLEN